MAGTGESPARYPTQVPADEDRLGTTLITHGQIIDGTGAAPLANGAVVIQDGRLTYVGPAVGAPAVLKAMTRCVLQSIWQGRQQAVVQREFPCVGRPCGKPSDELGHECVLPGLNELQQPVKLGRFDEFGIGRLSADHLGIEHDGEVGRQSL